MIDVGAKKNAAKGPHEEAGPECHESQHQLRKIASGRKKHFANCAGVITKYKKIVHLQEIAARNPDHRPNLLFALFRTERSHLMFLRYTRLRWPVAALTIHGSLYDKRALLLWRSRVHVSAAVEMIINLSGSTNHASI